MSLRVPAAEQGTEAEVGGEDSETQVKGKAKGFPLSAMLPTDSKEA